MLPYLPPATSFVTLQVPHLPVGIEHQVLAILREISERDVPPQLAVRRTALIERKVSRNERGIAHAQVGILARLLEGEEPREHGSVAFGGHAAVVVKSDVAGYAVRQEPILSGRKGHPAIVV